MLACTYLHRLWTFLQTFWSHRFIDNNHWNSFAIVFSPRFGQDIFQGNNPPKHYLVRRVKPHRRNTPVIYWTGLLFILWCIIYIYCRFFNIKWINNQYCNYLNVGFLIGFVKWLLQSGFDTSHTEGLAARNIFHLKILKMLFSALEHFLFVYHVFYDWFLAGPCACAPRLLLWRGASR